MSNPPWRGVHLIHDALLWDYYDDDNSSDYRLNMAFKM